MSDLIVHNINISYDESDERVRNFIKYLQRPEMKEAIRNYYEQGRKNKDNKIYLSDKAGNEFTMISRENHNCLIGLRGM